MMTLAWMDKRIILMLSTWHNNQKTIKRRWAKSQEQELEKPDVIIDYTENMGAVDRSDHYCASYFSQERPSDGGENCSSGYWKLVL